MLHNCEVLKENEACYWLSPAVSCIHAKPPLGNFVNENPGCLINEYSLKLVCIILSNTVLRLMSIQFSDNSSEGMLHQSSFFGLFLAGEP